MQLFFINCVYRSKSGRLAEMERQVRKMGALDKMSDFETRERVTRVILDFLAQLPELQRKMFICSHYQGLEVARIAENMHCSNSDVEGVLRQVSEALAFQTEHMRT